MKIFMLILLTIPYSHAFDVNLDRSGDIFEDEIFGRVSVRCNGNMIRTIRCYDSNLRGGNYGTLVVTNGSIDADYVKLQREGSRYIKGAKFNAETGQSTVDFNLWVGSALQRPLLTRELNKIKYKFFKNKELVDEGVFEVNVAQGEANDCGWDSRMYQQCPSDYQACSDFFRFRNYCQ